MTHSQYADTRQPARQTLDVNSRISAKLAVISHDVPATPQKENAKQTKATFTHLWILSFFTWLIYQFNFLFCPFVILRQNPN
jgi:hypothetical protein